MYKRIIASCFILFFISYKIFAQDLLKINEDKDSKKDTKEYKIHSLEGKEQVIHIMPDYYNRVLKISCLKDTVVIDGYWGDPAEIHILDRKFLMINYDVRGGSNLGLGNTLILCVSGNNLYEALHILRYASWDSGDLIKTYNIKITSLSAKHGYAIKVNTREKVISQNDPETNYHYISSCNLAFDERLKVFYSIKSDMNDTLKVSYSNLTYSREIQGNFPEVLLGKMEYLFIGNQWFEYYHNTLTKY